MTDTRPNSRGIPRAPLPPDNPSGRTTSSHHTASARAVRRRPWIAFGLSVVTLFVALWIIVPAPNRLFMNLSVGAPEVSVWLVLMAIVALIGAARTWSMHAIARATVVTSTIALALALSPFVRFPATANRAAAHLQETLGADYLDAVPFDRQLAMRATPLDFTDLLRGMPGDSAIVARNLSIATVAGTRLTGIVYRPPRTGTYPIVVQTYGGAWQRGSADSFSDFAKYLAARGYVVFAIDYRHAPQFTFDQQYADILTSLAWVRRNAAKYHGDTTRMALIGRSAGAHLSLLAAYDSTLAPVRAVVSYYGPVDLVDAYLSPPSPDPLDIRDIERKFIGAPLEQAKASYEKASPINHVRSNLPPTLQINARRDHVVQARFGDSLHAALRNHGNTSLLVEIPWADHAFDEVSNGPSSQLSRYVTERFLAWALTSQWP
ncbi:MAG: alpha/beta hydrolase fold domain-containing protein [Gemmatimonas sp.]